MKLSLLLPALCLGFPVAPVKAEPQVPAAAKELFRAVVPPEEYDRRLTGYDPRLLDRARIEANKAPEWGATVGAADPDGPAAAAGLTAGWTIIRCDEKEIWHRKQELDPDNADRQIVAVSPEGEKKTFHFPAGRLGIDVFNLRRPEREVMREVPAGPWDGDILAAVQAWSWSEQDMAETALNHALAKGMPANPIVDFYAALLALDRGDETQAKERCDAVLKTMTRGRPFPRFFRQGMRTLGMGLHNMGLLKKSSVELAGVPGELQPGQVENWERKGAEKMTTSLLPQALVHAGEDVMPKVVAPKDGWEQMYANNDPAGLAKSYSPSAPVGRYIGFAFTGPAPMHDLIWEIKGMYGDKGSEPGDRSFDIGIFDAKLRAEYGAKKQWQPEAWRVAYMSMVKSDKTDRTTNFLVGPDGGMLESHRLVPRLNEQEAIRLGQDIADRAPVQPPDDRHVFDIKFIRIGDEVEIIVNGVSYEHLPIPSSVGDLGCELQFSGVEAAIMSCTLREIKR